MTTRVERNNVREAAMRERDGDHKGGALGEDYKGTGTIHKTGTPEEDYGNDEKRDLERR